MVTVMAPITFGQTLLSDPEPIETTVEEIETSSDELIFEEEFDEASLPSEAEINELLEQLKKDPDKVAAGALNILLGGIGVGHFYTGQTLLGVLDIIFCWTGVPELIGIIEGIIWLCEDDEAWAERCAKWNSK